MVASFAGLGTAGGFIGFTNRSSTVCRLTGWPTLVALSTAGTATTAVHVHATMFGPYSKGGLHIKSPPVVTLRHGERADAVFTGADDPYQGGTKCPSLYRYLRVTPPGNAHSVVLSAWLPWLNAYLPGCTRIDVSMVVPRGRE